MILTDDAFRAAGDRHQAVQLALGAASTCWQHPEDAGRYDGERAADVADDLIRYLDIAP